MKSRTKLIQTKSASTDTPSKATTDSQAKISKDSSPMSTLTTKSKQTLKFHKLSVKIWSLTTFAPDPSTLVNSLIFRVPSKSSNKSLRSASLRADTRTRCPSLSRWMPILAQLGASWQLNRKIAILCSSMMSSCCSSARLAPLASTSSQKRTTLSLSPPPSSFPSTSGSPSKCTWLRLTDTRLLSLIKTVKFSSTSPDHAECTHKCPQMSSHSFLVFLATLIDSFSLIRLTTCQRHWVAVSMTTQLSMCLLRALRELECKTMEEVRMSLWHFHQ